MRYTGLFLLFIVLFTACKKEEKVVDTSTPCMSMVEDPYPFSEYQELNKSYKVKFPPEYTYGGYIVFEGDYFIKKKYSGSDTLIITASYGPEHGQKSVYGPPLVNTEADKVDIEYNGQVQTLKKKGRLCAGNNTLGYYYVTLERSDTTHRNQGLAVLYLKHQDDYRQNIIADFPVTMEAEVKKIISTITTN